MLTLYSSSLFPYLRRCISKMFQKHPSKQFIIGESMPFQNYMHRISGCDQIFIDEGKSIFIMIFQKGNTHFFLIVTGIKALFQNKYWIMMTGMLALFFLMYSVNGGATVYYAKDILGDKNLVSTINGIFNIVQILGMFFIAMLVKKFGKRNVFSLGLILDIIGILVLNFSGGSMPVIVVSSVIRGIGNACGGVTMWAMVSDTIDYGEWKTGYRTEGLVNSAYSFGYKIGNGIGSALLGVILEVGGYVGNAAAQTASALTSIRICFVWIPIAVYGCGLIIMKFYHLDKEFDGIIADLKARK